MKLTDFRVTFSKKDNLKAFVSCKLEDAIWLTGIRVVEGPHHLFVSFPSRKDISGDYQDIFFPASREAREEMQGLILAAYNKALDATKPSPGKEGA